jgi:hypothetical protein
MSDEYTSGGAALSEDGKYRYRLWREWRGTHDILNWRQIDKDWSVPLSCVFVMLNPSTADASIDDPTIRRCVGFAKAWRFERLEVVNLFAFRATDPKQLLALRHSDDPVGVRNQEFVQQAIADAGRIVCAWGSHGDHLGQDETMLGWLGARQCHALGLTKDGHPKHPLYLRTDEQLVAFNGRRPAELQRKRP